MAAPESTYDGRIRTGYLQLVRMMRVKGAEKEISYPTLLANCLAASSDVASVHSGWSIPILSSTEENLCRSSAVSIWIGSVPSTLTLFSFNRRAMFCGSCPARTDQMSVEEKALDPPPTLTTTPLAC